MSGRQQERRRSPIALHARDEESRFGMGQFLRAMRPDGTAAMHVRVDEGADLTAALEPGIQRESDLMQEGKVGTEACRNNDLFDNELSVGFSVAVDEQ